MEGGLPERYRKEDELEHQREVHISLITRGLGVISDSYHDVVQELCDQAQVTYRRLSPEGKNYRRLVDAAASGEHDFLALGALGLGAIPGGTVGTVCERVVRRARARSTDRNRTCRPSRSASSSSSPCKPTSLLAIMADKAVESSI
jgi:hypothetical protein